MSGTARRGWLIRSSVRDGAFNALSVTGRPLFGLLLVAFAAAMTVTISARERDTFQQTLQQQAALGRGTISFGSTDELNPAHISTSSCSELTHVNGVERAGPLVNLGTDTVAQLGTRIPVFATTRTMLPDLTSGNLVVGSTFPVTSGLLLSSERFGAVSAIQAPQLPEVLPVNSAINVLLDPATRTTELCIAILDDAADAGRLLPYLAARLEVTGGRLESRRALSPQFDPVADYLNRTSRWLWIATGIALAFVSAMQLRFRNSELAAYRLSGTTRRDLYRILWFEQAFLSGVFATSSVIATLAIGTAATELPIEAMRLLAGLASWLIAFPLFALTALQQNPISQSKDR